MFCRYIYKLLPVFVKDDCVWFDLNLGTPRIFDQFIVFFLSDILRSLLYRLEDWMGNCSSHFRGFDKGHPCEDH